MSRRESSPVTSTIAPGIPAVTTGTGPGIFPGVQLSSQVVPGFRVEDAGVVPQLSGDGVLDVILENVNRVVVKSLNEVHHGFSISHLSDSSQPHSWAAVIT